VILGGILGGDWRRENGGKRTQFLRETAVPRTHSTHGLQFKNKNPRKEKVPTISAGLLSPSQREKRHDLVAEVTKVTTAARGYHNQLGRREVRLHHREKWAQNIRLCLV
jgi:hypothetical protein